MVVKEGRSTTFFLHASKKIEKFSDFVDGDLKSSCFLLYQGGGGLWLDKSSNSPNCIISLHHSYQSWILNGCFLSFHQNNSRARFFKCFYHKQVFMAFRSSATWALCILSGILSTPQQHESSAHALSNFFIFASRCDNSKMGPYRMSPKSHGFIRREKKNHSKLKLSG